MANKARQAAKHAAQHATGSDPGQSAEFWTRRSALRKKRAVQACREYDGATLAVLVDAFRQLDRGRDRKAPDGTKKSTQRVYSGGIRAWVAYAQEQGLDLLAVTQDEAATWLRSLEVPVEEGGVAPATLQVRFSAVKWLYTALRRIEVTNLRPFDDIRLVSDERANWERRDSYTVEEADKLIAAATALKDKEGDAKYLAFAISLGIYAGLRASEIVTVQFRDVHAERRMLQVRRAKGGKFREVALLQKAITCFNALPPPARQDARVYPWSTTKLRRAVKALCERENVPYKGIHSLRHSHGEMLARQGVSLETVAAQLGHASVSTTQIYVKLRDTARVHEAFDGSGKAD